MWQGLLAVAEILFNTTAFRGLFGGDGKEGENLKIAKTNRCEHLRAYMFNAIFKGTASKLLMHSNPEADKFGQEVCGQEFDKIQL